MTGWVAFLSVTSHRLLSFAFSAPLFSLSLSSLFVLCLSCFLFSFPHFFLKKSSFSVSLKLFYFLTFFCSLFFSPFIFYLSPILLFQPLVSVTSSQIPLPPLVHVTNGCLKIWLWFKPHLGIFSTSYCVCLRACVCMHIICLVLLFWHFSASSTIILCCSF